MRICVAILTKSLEIIWMLQSDLNLSNHRRHRHRHRHRHHTQLMPSCQHLLYINFSLSWVHSQVFHLVCCVCLVVLMHNNQANKLSTIICWLCLSIWIAGLNFKHFKIPSIINGHIVLCIFIANLNHKIFHI